MKIVQTWKRNPVSLICGESLTLTYTFFSFNKAEIDKIEQRIPKGIWVTANDEEEFWYINDPENKFCDDEETRQ